MKLFIHENAFETVKWRPFCQGGDEFNDDQFVLFY